MCAKTFLAKFFKSKKLSRFFSSNFEVAILNLKRETDKIFVF